ncbi:hypothetical protein BGZ99_000275 [Dissophora globulifera]|uniref:DUF605-domain-containing protein n=1 Tax=Dissophora globulifera TaxID=979702 RepID=A0A9P6RQM9_9FUNG|nr:hypothetical protein BGZ99_000275 [Dissophora globulifera]
MSAPNVPPGLKSIAPYLQRAAQLQERDPVVSYYANYYAAKLAIPKAGADNSNKLFVVELLDTLEKQRKEIGNNEAISSDLVGYAHIENFALKIFTKADDEDRNGQGSQKTAKNFVAAANFLELLKVFGDIDSEVEEKIKYSKWRAAEIVKAIRDGRQPAPPPGANLPAASDVSLTSADVAMAGLDSLDIGLTPGAMAPPSAASVTPQPMMGGAGFPTISNFPSPPVESSNMDINSNDGSNINNTNMGQNNWSQPAVSPAFDQSQNFYSPAGTPGLPPQQPPVQTHLQPAAASSPAPGPGYSMPGTGSNPMSPNLNNNAQQGYAANNNNNNLYNNTNTTSYYQAPGVPPSQTPYAQPGFNAPTAPYQQQQQQQQPQPPQQAMSPQPYAPVPMVLDPAVNTQVQKHCKWTVSALTYDDIPTAIDNLEKALALLRPYNTKQ